MTFIIQPVHKRGFSLIELMVTIAVMLIITGGAIAGFLAFRDRQAVRESALQVRQLFVMAQQKASVREIPSNCIVNSMTSLRGYRVTVSATAPHTVTVWGLCFEPNPATPIVPPFPAVAPGTGTYASIESITLPSAVTINNSTSFDFYTLEGGTTSTQTYVFSGSSTSYRFSVTTGGTISNVTTP